MIYEVQSERGHIRFKSLSKLWFKSRKCSDVLNQKVEEKTIWQQKLIMNIVRIRENICAHIVIVLNMFLKIALLFYEREGKY